MADTLVSRTMSVRIARAHREVYDFASVPENFPRWASGLARSLKKVNGEWKVQYDIFNSDKGAM